MLHVVRKLFEIVLALKAGTLSLREIASLRRQRRHLARLNAHLLDDIGVTLDEAEQEGARAFWDLPEHLSFKLRARARICENMKPR